MGEAASGFAGGIFTLPSEMMGGINWLVVSTPLKNISQLGLLFPIYGENKNVPNHQPASKFCI